ncbi:MAG: class I SAM-dependent methyltransferase [Promethearchaeota archaeon]|nr:MAG: class I SAM-dependent methyltransferase [Candidatus Lokiarchaeota archaeon]
MEHWDLFFEIHSNNPREGPGDNKSTKKAFSYLKELASEPIIVDIGCGPGMQTVQLAKLTDGTIIAIDNHQPFLDELKKRAEKEGVIEKIKVKNVSVLDLSFKEKSVDVFWAESSIYIYGFEKGLKDWKKLLKKNGYFVVSELSWIKSNPPNECKQFFNEEYPQMNLIEENIAIIKDLGYDLIHYFEIPKQSWLDNYYNPLKIKITSLKKKYYNDKEKLEFLKSQMEEITIFERYNEYYGYVFYIMQRS